MVGLCSIASQAVALTVGAFSVVTSLERDTFPGFPVQVGSGRAAIAGEQDYELFRIYRHGAVLGS